MDTISKQLKDALRTAMLDGETYSNEAFRHLVYKETGMRFKEDDKETHFAGCLSALKKNGEIIQVGRGEYIKGKPRISPQKKAAAESRSQELSQLKMDETMSMAQVKNEIKRTVEKEVVFLKCITQNIILSYDTPAEDIQYMLRLKELVKKLEEFEQKTDL